jgi:hypothetical protein
MRRLNKRFRLLCGIAVIPAIIISLLLPPSPIFASDNIVSISPAAVTIDNGDDFSVYLDLSIGDIRIDTIGFQLDWSSPAGSLQCTGISLATGSGSFFAEIPSNRILQIHGGIADNATTSQFSYALRNLNYIQGPQSGHVAVISFHALADGEVTIHPCDVQLALVGETISCDVVDGTVTIGSGERSSGGDGTTTESLRDENGEDSEETTDDVNFVRVDKPFSVNPREAGYQLQPGSIVRHLANGITEITGPDNKLIARTRDSDAELVPTPSGLTRATHIFQVPNKSRVITTDNIIKIYSNDIMILTIINEDPQPPPPEIKGWIESAKSAQLISISHFSAKWNVPISPVNDQPGNYNINYIFNGIEDFFGGSIIQPVLQWNRGWDHRWSCNTYYVVGTTERILGERFDANVGDEIYGTMDWNTNSWNVSITNLANPQQSTQINVTDLSANWDWLALALEGANPVSSIFTDNDVCGTVQFTDVEISCLPPIVAWMPDINHDKFPLLTNLNVEISPLCTLYTNGGNPSPVVGLIVLPVNKIDMLISFSAVTVLPVIVLSILLFIRRRILLGRR